MNPPYFLYQTEMSVYTLKIHYCLIFSVYWGTDSDSLFDVCVNNGIEK